MDCIDVEILNSIQEGIPIDRRPFENLAHKIGITEQEVLNRINILKKEGYIRKFGGIFDSHNLGYFGTLCGMAVPVERVDNVAKIINSYVEITHNYLRETNYNMWFTIVAESKSNIQGIIEEIKLKTGIKDILNLPSKKLFKVKAAFRLGSDLNVKSS